MRGFLDNDYYKLLTQQLIFEKQALQKPVKYKVFSRTQSIPRDILCDFKRDLILMKDIQLLEKEKEYLKSLGFTQNYLDWLEKYRYDPKQVKLGENDAITVEGDFLTATLWEIPILATLNRLCSKPLESADYDKLKEKYIHDAGRLSGCNFVEFGSRRRHSWPVQDWCVNHLKKWSGENFLGTSNVGLALKYNVKPIGTIPHEFIMAVYGSVIEKDKIPYARESLANMTAMEMLPANSIILSDTFTTDTFLLSFDKCYANKFKGLRLDSGDVFAIGEKVINHYNSLGIDPKTKTLVFSDALDPNKCLRLQKRFGERINITFGIGGYFGNPFKEKLDVVMKLIEFDGKPVYKISDSPGKSTKPKE